MDILITHLNQYPVVKESLNSLVEALPDQSRIYVVDAGSTDGSFSHLEKRAADEEIDLLLRNGISRGKGRQIAFEMSDDELVLAHVDLDTTFQPILTELVNYYQKLRDKRGPGLLIFHGGMLGTRKLIANAGGWNDLQVHEDKDLWLRLYERADVYVLPISIVSRHDNFEWHSWRYRIKRIYQNYRDAIRLGLSKEMLRQSLSYHQSRGYRVLDHFILEKSSRDARGLKHYDALTGYSLNPKEHFLRELTFEALNSTDEFNPTFVSPSQMLERFHWNDSYPGQTSYGSVPGDSR